MQSKAAALAAIDAHRTAWDAMLLEAQGKDVEAPGGGGDWSFKDTIAHVNGWHALTVARLEAALHGEPPPTPWNAADGADPESRIDAVNRRFYAENHTRPAKDIVADARSQFTRMRAAVEALPDAALLEPGHFPWLDGHPLVAVLDWSFAHLDDEHGPDIHAWLSQRG